MPGDLFSPKQREFILNASAKYNIAHGSVRAGKTVCGLWKFMTHVANCPGSMIWLLGRSLKDVYLNCIQLILDSHSPHFSPFSKLCTWKKHSGELLFMDKTIVCIGAGDEGAVGQIQGKTFDLCYCNEMTLYPDNVIQMISTRLSNPHSVLYADMNPVEPSHICKQWIDRAAAGEKEYYQLHFTIDDNPFLTEEYKKIQRDTLTGLFLRRNYYGEWCLAEGAIFDFFDKKIHMSTRARGTTLHWIAGIDYGTDHAFACVLIRVSELPEGKELWVEKEYYYSSKNKRQKAPSEYAEDLVKFFEGFAIKAVYLDPSAAMFKAELSRKGYHTVPTNNEVYDGILTTVNALKNGTLLIGPNCPNLVREMEQYAWDPKKSKLGKDEPIKENDDCCDALRYAVKSCMGTRSSFKVPESEKKDFNIGRPYDKNRASNEIDWGRGWEKFK